MYFTINAVPPSSPAPLLSLEALDSYRRLHREAEVLAGLSASFAAEAETVSGAYLVALAAGSPQAWATFVAAADSLVRHYDTVGSILKLSARERAAYDFFAQIACENDDLLVSTEAYSAA